MEIAEGAQHANWKVSRHYGIGKLTLWLPTAEQNIASLVNFRRQIIRSATIRSEFASSSADAHCGFRSRLRPPPAQGF